MTTRNISPNAFAMGGQQGPTPQSLNILAVRKT
jgi:hypothetical protein